MRSGSMTDEAEAAIEGAPMPKGASPARWLALHAEYLPLAFLGLGIYRAWIELVYVGSFVSFPFAAFAGHDVYDLSMIAVLFAGAAFHRRLEPLIERRAFYLVTALLMAGGTLLAWISFFMPGYARALALPAAVIGGAGTALVILLWSELYSCLSPFRVGLYYCASIVVAAIVVYLFHGFKPVLLAGGMAALPVISLAMLSHATRSLTAQERRHVSDRDFPFPWKPAVLMAVYAFAFSLRELSQYSSGFGPHSAFGTLFMGALLFFLIARRGSGFSFETFYRIALPLMVGAFLVLPAFGWFNEQISNFCATASYTAFSVLIMVLMASLSYKYGMSALWLFGIERGVRALVTVFGRQFSCFIEGLGSAQLASLVTGSLTVTLVVAGTLLFASEKDFFAHWGVSFKDDRSKPTESSQDSELKHKLAHVVGEYELTPRESEVLSLMAAGKTTAQMQQELFVSKDTVKSHVKHIYKKMGVHSREELMKAVEEALQRDIL